MKARRSAAALAALLLLSACSTDRVELSYRLREEGPITHRLLLDALVTRTLAGDRREQRVRATFRTVQRVLEELPDGGARTSVSLEPLSLSVDGAPAAPGPEQRFVLVITGDGRVQQIESETGPPAEALAPVGLDRLLPRLRPVLPPGPVSLGDDWGARTSISDAAGSFSVETSSRLGELGLAAGHPAALIRSSYTSPVERTETLANAVADIRGRDMGNQQAWFALSGFLVRSTGDSVGSYRVEFRPPGGETDLAPVRGSLVVALHTEMELEGTG